jgi:hypothetical protein
VSVNLNAFARPKPRDMCCSVPLIRCSITGLVICPSNGRQNDCDDVQMQLRTALPYPVSKNLLTLLEHNSGTALIKWTLFRMHEAVALNSNATTWRKCPEELWNIPRTSDGIKSDA